MKNIQYFKFRISFFLFFFLINLSLQVLSQDRRYFFNEGDVMEYELIESSEEDDDDSIFVSKIRFTVNRVDKDYYHMTMQLLSWSMPGLLTISGQTVQHKPELRASLGIVRSNMGRANAELNNPISFILDSKGGIHDIQGYEKIQEDILQAAEKSINYKKHHNFSVVSTFYGLQKCRYMISDFFPALPSNLNDTVRFKSGETLALRINQWIPQEKKHAFRDKLILKRVYKFILGKPDPHEWGPKDTTNEMYVIWPENKGQPHRIIYKGYVNSFFTQEGFVDANLPPSYSLGQVEIIKTYHANQLSKKVRISGSLTNFEEHKLRMSLPGNGISKESVELKPNNDGSFLVEFELDCKAGLVDVYSSADEEPIFKLFVQPGDSICLTCNLNEIREIQFKGLSALEQHSLNYLSKDGLDKRYQAMDPFFVRFMRVEEKYAKYASQVWEYTKKPGKQEISKYDMLKANVKHLGYSEGYIHDSYKNFVRSMVWANQSIPRQKGGLMDLAELVLIDWDLYWFKAYWTERYIKDDPDYTSDYHRFADLYPGTPFQKALEKLHKQTKKWQEGQHIPKFKYTDLEGKVFKNKKLKDQYWGLITVNGSYKQALGMIKQAIKFNEWQEMNMKFLVWWPNQGVLDTLQTVINNENVTLLAGPENNAELSEFLQDFPKDYLIIDPMGRITSYSLDYLENLISWPLVKNDEERTIKLKVFWYTAIGVILLATLIILSIRIRGKRKEARLNLKRKMAQLEVDAVRSRMNPHFLFNALGSIQNLVNRGKNEEASLYLARFGDLVRTILFQSSKSVIGLNEEIDMIRNYLLLEQLGSPFTFDIIVESMIDPATIEIPPLLLQPHVENALIHGIPSLGEKGNINLNFRMDKTHLICEIKDNGPGYKKGSEPNKGGLGQGWKLTHQRIQLMKEQYDEEVSVEVTNDKQRETKPSELYGTIVTFRLPIQKSSL